MQLLHNIKTSVSITVAQVHEAADKSETCSPVIRCSSGLDESDAVAYCSNCCCYLCEACWNNHRKQVFTQSHIAVSLEEIKHSDKPTGAKSLGKVQHCEDHEDEVLKLFCKTCKKVICRDCALVEHRDHEFVFIREIRPEIQQQLESLNKEVQAKEVEYRNYIDYVENIRKIGTDTLTACEREVNETCHRLQEAIESRRAALIAQLHDIHDLEKKQVDSEADGLQFTLLKLLNSISFTQQLLANGSDVEVVSMGVQATQTLENLRNANWNKNSVKPTLMRVKFDTNLEKHVNTFGVTSHKIQPKDILVKTLPKQSKVSQELQFEVHLSKDISEKGYVAASDLVVQLTHTTSSAETVCDVRKIGLNTWAVSCIPTAAGKYKVSATLDHIEEIPLTVESPDIDPEAQEVCVLVYVEPGADVESEAVKSTHLPAYVTPMAKGPFWPRASLGTETTYTRAPSIQVAGFKSSRARIEPQLAESVRSISKQERATTSRAEPQPEKPQSPYELLTATAYTSRVEKEKWSWLDYVSDRQKQKSDDDDVPPSAAKPPRGPLHRDFSYSESDDNMDFAKPSPQFEAPTAVTDHSAMMKWPLAYKKSAATLHKELPPAEDISPPPKKEAWGEKRTTDYRSSKEKRGKY